MRLLITILLFSTLKLSAQRAAAAMNMTATKMQSGILIAGNTLTVSQKVALASDSLHCQTARMSITVSSWSGSSAAYELYAAAGLNVIPNLNYYSTGSVQPFPTSAELSTLTTNVTSILNTYPSIKIVCVENEELTTSYHSGPLSDYVAEVAAVYNVCHPRGVLVMNGGIGGLNSGLDVKVYRWLATFDATKAAEYAAHMAGFAYTAAINPGTNSSLEKFCRQLDTLEAMKPYIDIFNFHTKEVQDATGGDHSAVTSITTHQLMYKADYARSRYGKLLADNEAGADNSQPLLVTASMNEYLRCGYTQVQWWSGTGPNAAPLHDDAGDSLFVNGDALRDFNLMLENSINSSGGTAMFYNGAPTSLPYIKNPTNVTSAPFITSGTRSDTMVITGSSLGSAYFGNINGVDSLHPFVVYYNNTYGAGIGIENCKYIKVIGIGTATISGGGTNGYVKGLVDYVQVSGFLNLDGSSGSWWLKTEPGDACSYSNPEDYLNDSTVITKRMKHVWFTHNQIGNSDGTHSCGGEGVYAISTGAYGRDHCYCEGNRIIKPLWGQEFHIDSNIFYNTGRTAIQLSGTDIGWNTINGNKAYNCGRELDSTQGAGIRTGYGTTNQTEIANNYVANTYIYNYDLETGAYFHDNVGDSAGFWKQTQNPQGVSSTIASALLPNSTVIIKNNTMGKNTASPPTGFAIYGGSNYTNFNQLCGNVPTPIILQTPFNYTSCAP